MCIRQWRTTCAILPRKRSAHQEEAINMATVSRAGTTRPAMTTEREEIIRTACHTAVSELGEQTDSSDLMDCVVGQVSEDIYDEVNFEPFALYWLRQYGADISSWCQGHETENFNGPIGETTYCNGMCEARIRL